MIPKIIHQTWKTQEVPEHWKESQEEWQKLMDYGWEYMLWTDEDNRNLILGFSTSLTLMNITYKGLMLCDILYSTNMGVFIRIWILFLSSISSSLCSICIKTMR